MYVKNISSTWNSFNQQKENKQTNVLKKTNKPDRFLNSLLSTAYMYVHDVHKCTLLFVHVKIAHQGYYTS